MPIHVIGTIGLSTSSMSNERAQVQVLLGFPDNIDTLIKPEPDAPGTEHARGFQRYDTTKLAVVMFMHDLNRRLKAVRMIHP